MSQIRTTCDTANGEFNINQWVTKYSNYTKCNNYTRFNNRTRTQGVMALKRTSSGIIIGASVVESAKDTFTQQAVDLQLNPLDNEVFIVQAIDMMLGRPDAVAGTDTLMIGCLTTTSQTAMPAFNSSNVLSMKQHEITSANATSAVAFSSGSNETPPTSLDHIGIISTNDFFLQVQGHNNVAGHSLQVKVYGYRAKADSATYAALVQSEVLSS